MQQKPSDTIIEAKDLTKTYGRGEGAFTALHGLTLSFRRGEAVAILGKSGSGKSTLMHVLAGLDRPTTGEVLYNDEPISAMREAALSAFRNHNVGFVFQQFFLQPKLTVLENVALPLKIAGMGRTLRNKAAMEALKKVDLADKAGNRATDLSGGQKQRAAIARALVTKPEVIFADEPTGNLDSETADDVIKLLFDLNKRENITLVVVTHDADLAKLCDRELRLVDGRIAQ